MQARCQVRLSMCERIYRYVVRYDCGTAPRPYGGLCSLAICKPMIRRNAAVGDWIIGFRSQRPGEVVYVMQISERLPLGNYWSDPRFANRRPRASPIPDNFYRATDAGSLVQVRNSIHGPTEAAKDIRGRHALLGRRFWYFGVNSVPLPNELMHLVHATQGHAVHKARRPNDVANLRHWLAAWKPGIHGAPIGGETPGFHRVSVGARIVNQSKESCNRPRVPRKRHCGTCP